MEIINEVKDIVIEQLKIDQENINEDSRFVEDFGADSLDRIELIMAIEEKFNIEISDEEAEKLLTFSDLVKHIDNICYERTKYI